MGTIGKIAVIKKEYSKSEIQTMDSNLAQKGMTRVPGTGVFKFPYKEVDGRYRTGLDPNASYIKRISDPLEREVEIERVTKLRDKLQAELGDIDLGPRAPFWNYALSQSSQDTSHVQPVKLLDGDNYFDLTVPFHELTFAWLRVHPTIASTYQAWESGDYPADTQFYVADDEIESKVLYNKKAAINKAIIKFDSMTAEKKRKVARLLGLPVSDDTMEEIVYNQIDNLLKKSEMDKGAYAGLNPVEVFTRFADMQDQLLHIKDLVKQAIGHSIYRVKPNGHIYEGEFEIASDEDELVRQLVDDDKQEDLLALETKLKAKKLAVK